MTLQWRGDEMAKDTGANAVRLMSESEHQAWGETLHLVRALESEHPLMFTADSPARSAAGTDSARSKGVTPFPLRSAGRLIVGYQAAKPRMGVIFLGIGSAVVFVLFILFCVIAGEALR